GGGAFDPATLLLLAAAALLRGRRARKENTW
ncbi:MAG: GlyGly-CTERM sorting domain-containing protein, partial [Gammaproteobacteria bacterium]|nr:GlyGly-CTERM sorting domain-containing protein [Gammaproteobacteria bacterium]